MLGRNNYADRLPFRWRMRMLSRSLKRRLSRSSNSAYAQGYPKGTLTHPCKFDGVKINLDFRFRQHRRIYSLGGFEPVETAILRSIARSGDVFVDIGANLGWHTVCLLVKRSDVRISYAFEPSRLNFDLLKSCLSANDVLHRCSPRQVALSDRKGTATLKYFPNLGPMNSSLYSIADWPYETEEVTLDTLDSATEAFIAPPTLIKCDVEGAEMDVLKGAQEVLKGKF